MSDWYEEHCRKIAAKRIATLRGRDMFREQFAKMTNEQLCSYATLYEYRTYYETAAAIRELKIRRGPLNRAIKKLEERRKDKQPYDLPMRTVMPVAIEKIEER